MLKNYKKVLDYIQRQHQGPTRHLVQKFCSTCPTSNCPPTTIMSGQKRKGDAKHVSVEEVARAKWICLNKITYKDPHGTERIWEGVSRTTKLVGEADAVGMIATFVDPMTDVKSVIMVRQYRPPVEKYTIEFPAGLIDKDESASEAAIREMKEETGYDVTVDHVSGATGLDAGVGSATLKIVSCQVDTSKLSKEERPKPTGGEFVQVIVHPVDSIMEKLQELASAGNCVDSRVYTWALAIDSMKAN